MLLQTSRQRKLTGNDNQSIRWFTLDIWSLKERSGGFLQDTVRDLVEKIDKTIEKRRDLPYIVDLSQTEKCQQMYTIVDTFGISFQTVKIL